MKRIEDLNFGYNDAENYKRRENKELFNHIFVRTNELDRLIAPDTFFLMGEKGTGKTAYAVYLSNNNYRETSGVIRYIRETEYQKFIALKKEKQLNLSDYTNIWKVILYLILAEIIHEKEATNIVYRSFPKFKSLKDAIDEYYSNAFSPEIIQAIQFIEHSQSAAELISKYAKAGGEESYSITFSESKFQTNLLYIQRKFEETLRSLKLGRSHILFVDGIDIRPAGIPYSDYLECIKGLANAVWSMNNDFFPSIKDSKGRIKVVLLIRPDIFNSLGMQNQNNKIRDNSIYLNWQTTYMHHRTSPIFAVVDKLLMFQQCRKLADGEAWDFYFPYKVKNLKTHEDTDDSFVEFLRHSYYRPRDFISMLRILQENFNSRTDFSRDQFIAKDFDSGEFKHKYADYLLGELKDNLSFYYTNNDYELFLKFFEYLNGKHNFDYDTYIDAFNRFEAFVQANSIVKPDFFETPDIFLQFLYELNVISFSEYVGDEVFVRWSFRERNVGNFSPKVKVGESYSVHRGLSRALNTGRTIWRRS
ncbi:MAG: hypothetical protein R2682_08370 [Pyrinomonadaceae bacterium]